MHLLLLQSALTLHSRVQAHDGHELDFVLRLRHAMSAGSFPDFSEPACVLAARSLIFAATPEGDVWRTRAFAAWSSAVDVQS